MRDLASSTIRWTIVFAFTLATSACNTLPQAIEGVRWTTPLDAKKEALTITDAVADARKTGSEEHKAILEEDPAALAAAGQAATEREDKLREEQINRIKAIERALAEAIAAIGGGGGGLGAALIARFVETDKTAGKAAEEAKGTARGASDEVERVAKSTEVVTGRLGKVEEIVAKLDTETLGAIRSLTPDQVEKLLAAGSRDQLVETLRSELTHTGLSPERIEQLIAQNEGSTKEELIDLILAVIGGGAIGTGGGRVLSGSGKRIDEAKKEIGELYDEVVRLRERK
ncbi:MAG: hypothetical protein HOP15_11150 [Planctomycetes bacterium]|nr:hypothetical protein [Planctomycetota bacterium]